jgi:hypothetical protein
VRQDTYPVETKLLGGATADLALGVLKGFATNGFGSVDVLVSATYLPSYTGTSIEVKEPGGSLKLGVGAKVGLLRESATRPGVSLSYIVRETPRVDITAKSGDDRLFLRNVDVKAKSWRAVAAKKLLFLGIGAGFGRDSYDSNADITVTVAPRQATNGGTGADLAFDKFAVNIGPGQTWDVLFDWKDNEDYSSSNPVPAREPDLQNVPAGMFSGMCSAAWFAATWGGSAPTGWRQGCFRLQPRWPSDSFSRRSCPSSGAGT